MKMSEVTVQTLKDYCRVDGDEENTLFESFLAAGKQYIMSQTGLTAEQCDEKADLAVALLVVCNDMYANRELTFHTGRVGTANRVVESILGQYCVNLL